MFLLLNIIVFLLFLYIVFINFNYIEDDSNVDLTLYILVMRNKSKQDESSQRDMNHYERIKLQRVQENQAKLRELSVQNIAKSLTSLVESQKTKKNKKKSMDTNERDVDYVGADNDGDGREVASRVQASQKQHHPRYIAPMSINRYANFAKQKRVIASNMSDMFPFDTTTTKKSRLHQSQEKPDTNATKSNLSRGSITMGELILSKKGSRKQDMKECTLKKNLTEPNDITSGAKRKLYRVHSDDDDMDDERYQELEEDDFSAFDDENEGDDLKSLGQDIQNEDNEHMVYENIEDDAQQSDSDDDIGDRDDELVEEQIESVPSQQATELSITKKRGPTMMHDVQVRNFNEREAIICNKFGQPIGPVTKEKDIVGQFSRFLGTIARTYSYAPLTYKEWRKVPHKEKMWEFVLVRKNTLCPRMLKSGF
ncbi:hypothetical protein Lser_V15G19646 [Lactuca serriola]